MAESRKPALTHTEPYVANGFAAEALLQLSQDCQVGNLFELVVQCGLEHDIGKCHADTSVHCDFMALLQNANRSVCWDLPDYLGASDATIFSKRGSPRSGSQ